MNCQQIIDEYLKWIKDNTLIKSIEEGKICSISTPFLDRHNDNIEIYTVKKEGLIKLTDNGYTIDDLKMSGFEINTPKRESILKVILNGYGVRLSGNEIFIETTINSVGQKKHYLLQAILAVNDMFNLSQETVYSLFKEDVELFFRSQGIVFSKDIKLTGKSGFDHNIDFLIPSFQDKPERLIKAINTARKDNILSSIMAFNDINQLRESRTKNYVIYNDIEKEVPREVIYALESYEVKHIPWSEKEFYLEEFSLN